MYYESNVNSYDYFTNSYDYVRKTAVLPSHDDSVQNLLVSPIPSNVHTLEKLPNTCAKRRTRVFNAAVFVTARTRNNPNAHQEQNGQRNHGIFTP